jgi:hypothetical protein
MSKPVEKLRLREVYQPLAEPVREAREAAMTSNASARVLRWIMGPPCGNDGTRIVYPFWGISKSFE